MGRSDNDAPDGFEPYRFVFFVLFVVRGRRYRLAPGAIKNGDGGVDAGGWRDLAILHDIDQHLERAFGLGAGELADRHGSGFRRRFCRRNAEHCGRLRRGAVRAYEVKDASSLLGYSVVVFRPSRAVAVILADQRTAAFRYAGWRPRAPGGSGRTARAK